MTFPPALKAESLDHFKTVNAYPYYRIVKQFDHNKILKLITDKIDYTKEIEVAVFNDRLQVLRFNIGLKNDLIYYNYGLAFELYEFDEDGYLTDLYYYDKHGKAFGDCQVDDVARREFIINDYKKIARKFRIIDSGDKRIAHIQLPERQSHVTMVLYNSEGEIIDDMPLSSVDYKLWCSMRFGSLKTPSY